MKMKNIKLNICRALLVITMLITVSCDKFLDYPPTKNSQIEVKKIEHLDALIVGMSTYTSNNAAALCSDLSGYTTTQYNLASGNMMGWNVLKYYLYNMEALANTVTSIPSYSQIFVANTVLGYVDKVEGDALEKENIKAEAHFLRALHNWEVLNTYCLPYSVENEDELGLPKKATTSFEESLERLTLKETYDNVESDIIEALKIKRTDLDRRWRASLPAVQAFAARFYLFKHNYDEAIKYANLALAANSQLVDYNTEMRYATRTVSTSRGQLYVPYTYYLSSATSPDYDPTAALKWKEVYYIYDFNYGMWYNPSQYMVDLYDQTNDWRFIYFFVEDYTWVMNMSFSWYGYSYFGSSIPMGPTVQEMLLIKAECQARKGEYLESMNTLNILRSKRMKPGAHVNLTAANKNDAILKVIDERTRELTWAMRFFDIRRYNNNETTIDDVIVKKTYFPNDGVDVDKTKTPIEYALTVKDRRFAMPFPANDVKLSNGQLIQNTY